MTDARAAFGVLGAPEPLGQTLGEAAAVVLADPCAALAGCRTRRLIGQAGRRATHFVLAGAAATGVSILAGRPVLEAGIASALATLALVRPEKLRPTSAAEGHECKQEPKHPYGRSTLRHHPKAYHRPCPGRPIHRAISRITDHLLRALNGRAPRGTESRSRERPDDRPPGRRKVAWACEDQPGRARARGAAAQFSGVNGLLWCGSATPRRCR